MMGLLGPCFSGIDSPRLAGPHSSQPSTHSRQPRLAIAPAPAPAPQAAAQKGSARWRAHGGRAGARPRGLGGARAPRARTAASPLGPMGNAVRARACGGRGAEAGGSGSVLGAAPSPCARPATRDPASGKRPEAAAETPETRRVDPRWPPSAVSSPGELLCRLARSVTPGQGGQPRT